MRQAVARWIDQVLIQIESWLNRAGKEGIEMADQKEQKQQKKEEEVVPADPEEQTGQADPKAEGEEEKISNEPPQS